MITASIGSNEANPVKATNKARTRSRMRSARRMVAFRRNATQKLPSTFTTDATLEYFTTLGGDWVTRPFSPRALWFALNASREARARLKRNVPNLLERGILLLPHIVTWDAGYAFFGCHSRLLALVHRLTIDLADAKLRSAGQPGLSQVVRYPISLEAYDAWRLRHGFDSKPRSIRQFLRRCHRRYQGHLLSGTPPHEPPPVPPRGSGVQSAKFLSAKSLPEDLKLDYRPNKNFDTPRPLPTFITQLLTEDARPPRPSSRQSYGRVTPQPRCYV